MLKYKDWLREAKIKKKDKAHGKQHGNQGSGTLGHVNHQGEANRPHQEVQSADVHFFPEP